MTKKTLFLYNFFLGVVPPSYSSHPNTLVPVANALGNITRASTPPILRRGSKARRKRDDSAFVSATDQSHDISMASTSTSGTAKMEDDIEFILDGAKPTIFSPIRNNGLLLGASPIKQLPFSPSQFLNSPNITSIMFDVAAASTPKKNHPETPVKDKSRPVSELLIFFILLILIAPTLVTILTFVMPILVVWRAPKVKKRRTTFIGVYFLVQK